MRSRILFKICDITFYFTNRNDRVNTEILVILRKTGVIKGTMSVG
jgi:hypothetical protein